MANERSGADQDLVRTYLDGIGRYPLLTKEDEVSLARRIERGRGAEVELKSLSSPPSRIRELRRIRRDGQDATEQFIKSNLRLVVSVAKKYQSAEMPLLDLIQEGNLGLMHAVEKFDWRKGFKFSTYATWWIRQAIGRGIDNSARTVRLPVHAGDQIRRVLRAKAQMEGVAESATKTKVAANFICPTHREQIKQKRWCESCNDTVDAVKAFNVDGVFVDVDEDMLEQLIADKTGELRIEHFVELDQIDPVYFNKPYLIYPGEGGASSYDLFATALRDSGRAAVGNAVFGGSKAVTMVVIRWSEATSSLVAHTCVYDNQLRWPDVDLVANAVKARPAPAKEQVTLARQILEAMSGSFDPAAVTDTYTEQLRDLLAQAAKGKLPKPQPKTAAANGAGDLMAALRASVQAAKGGGVSASPAKKPARKKTVKA